jgi:hypothetical protein
MEPLECRILMSVDPIGQLLQPVVQGGPLDPAQGPAVSVDLLVTDDRTPPLSGTVSDPASAVLVRVEGNDYTATNRGDGTWFLADDTIDPTLADGTYDVQVTATDADGNVGVDQTTDELTIAGELNEAPALGLANVTDSLPEDTDTTSHVKVADIVVADDGLGTNVLSLDGPDAALFEIADSALYLKAGTRLDFATHPELNVTVVVDDPAVGTSPDDITDLVIAVTDADRLPTVALASVTSSLPENADTSSRIKVADIVVTDDTPAVHNLSLSGADAALFEIDSSSLFLRAGTPLDHETHPQLDVTVAVDDPALGSTPDGVTSLSVAITDVNETPTVGLLNATTGLPEDTDTSARIKVADIVVTDDALGDNAVTLMGPDAGLFEIDGSSLYLKAGVTLDHEADPLLGVTVAVDDPTIGTSPDSMADLVIAVTDVTEPPTIAGIVDDTGIAGDGITRDPTLVVQGTAEANVTVKVFIDGAWVGATVADASGNWEFEHTGVVLPDGRYELTAQAQDAAGNLSAPSSVFIAVVDTVAPVVTVSSRTTTDTSPVLSGTVDDPLASVRVTLGGKVYQATNRGDGTWVLPDNTVTPALRAGTYEVQVAATDIAGNTTSDGATGTLTVQSTSTLPGHCRKVYQILAFWRQRTLHDLRHMGPGLGNRFMAFFDRGRWWGF